jgi:hypothetical protein
VGCECVSDAGPIPTKLGQQSQGFGMKYYPKMTHSKVMPEREAILRWYQVVEEYSGLDLTFQTDKLPGISAIAKQIHNARPHDKYLAGLWSSTLVQDLLWIPRSSGLPRSEEYCAPTWSWASFPGQVWYKVPKYPYIKYEYYAEMLDAICRPSSSEEHGQVGSAQLILRTQLAECYLRLDELSWATYIFASVHLRKLDEPISIQLDFDYGYQEGETLYIIRVADTNDEVEENNRNTLFHHLLLRKDPGTGVYYRAGSVTSWGREDLERCRRLFSGVPYSIIIIE